MESLKFKTTVITDLISLQFDDFKYHNVVSAAYGLFSLSSEVHAKFCTLWITG